MTELEMLRLVPNTAQRLKLMVSNKKRNLIHLDVRRCTICEEFIGYQVVNGVPYFDSSCGCGSSSPVERTWEEVAKSYWIYNIGDKWGELPELPVGIPKQSDNPEGLHKHYFITKYDGSPVDDDAEYLVLRLDTGGKDRAHVNAGRLGALAYAVAIQPHLPQLAQDIIDRYSGQLPE
jgi:hypothetical protein